MRTLYVSAEGASAHQLRAEAPEAVVDVCGTLDAARDWLGTRSYDAVLTDLNLPDGTALTLLAHIRTHEPTLPVVVVAGADDGMRFAALEAGADDYVVRSPQLGRSLLAAVRAARDRREYDHASLATCLHVLYIGRDASLRQRLTETPSVRVTAAPPEFEIDLDVSLCHVAVIDARSLNAVHQVRKLREVAPGLPLALMAQPTDYEVDARSLPLGVDEVIVRSENYQDQIVARLRRLAAVGRRKANATEEVAGTFSEWNGHERDEVFVAPPTAVMPTVVPDPVPASVESEVREDAQAPHPPPQSVDDAPPEDNPPVEPPAAAAALEEVASGSLGAPLTIEEPAPAPGVRPGDAGPVPVAEYTGPLHEPVHEDAAEAEVMPDLEWLKGYVSLRRRSAQVETAVDVLARINGLLETSVAAHPTDTVIQRAHALSGDFVAFARRHATPDAAHPLDDDLTSVAPMLGLLIGGGTELIVSAGAPGARVLMSRDEIVRVLTSLVMAGRDTLPIGGRLLLRTERQLIRAGDGSAAPPGTMLRVLRVSIEARGHIAHAFEIPRGVRDLIDRSGGECQPEHVADGLTGAAVCVPLVGDQTR